MDKLKKCPFCGGEATSYAKQKTHELLKEHGYEVTIFCNDCGAKVVKWCDMQGLAWGAAEGTWSNRKPVENVLKLIESEILEKLSDCGDYWYTAEKVNEAIEIIKEVLN